MHLFQESWALDEEEPMQQCSLTPTPILQPTSTVGLKRIDPVDPSDRMCSVFRASALARGNSYCFRQLMAECAAWSRKQPNQRQQTWHEAGQIEKSWPYAKAHGSVETVLVCRVEASLFHTIASKQMQAVAQAFQQSLPNRGSIAIEFASYIVERKTQS